jgi:peroxiredoxin
MIHVTGLFTFVLALAATDVPPKSQYEALVKEYDTTYAAYIDASKKASTDDERLKAAESRPNPQLFVPRFVTFAEQHPDDPAAIDALIWIASHCMFIPQGEQALKTLASRHSASQQVAGYAGKASRYGEAFLAYEELLRAVLKNNSDREVQASVCLTLAAYLKQVKNRAESTLIQISLHGERGLARATLVNLNQLKDRGFNSLAAESEALFDRVIKEYGDLRIVDNYPPEAGKYAKEQLYELRNLSIGNKAIEIAGTDIAGNPLKLSDYRGQIVLLDFGSHRTCGVCRQFYPGLRSLVERFKQTPFTLISINSLDGLDELKGLTNNKEITWRMVWDGEAIDGPIASQWMIRSMPTFYVLDHNGIIRNKGFIQIDELAGTIEMLLKEVAATKP